MMVIWYPETLRDSLAALLQGEGGRWATRERGNEQADEEQEEQEEEEQDGEEDGEEVSITTMMFNGTLSHAGFDCNVRDVV